MWIRSIDMWFSQIILAFFRTNSNENASNCTNTPDSGIDETTILPHNNFIEVKVASVYYLQSAGVTDKICGVNMKLFRVNSTHNVCDCCDVESAHGRMMIYDKNKNNCVPIFTQGPCGSGECVDINASWELICQRDHCCPSTFDVNGKEQELVMLNGTCVPLGGSSTFCATSEHVGFHQNKRLPTCITEDVQKQFNYSMCKSKFRAIAPPTVRCSPGTYRAISGQCIPAFDFD